MLTHVAKLTRNDSKFDASVLLPSYSFCFLHEKRSETLPVVHLSNVKRDENTFAYLVLELRWVSSVHRYSGAVYMELPHDARTTFCPIFMHKFWAKCSLFGALPEPKQSDEDITLRILVRKEGLPTTVRGIVPTQQLDRFWSNFVVDLVYLRGV